VALSAAFAAAMTGDDDDIILAAEHLMRDRVDALGADASIELMADTGAALAALRDVGEPVSCGCGAVTERECPAACENHFRSLEQRSDEELHRLRDGDECAAAGLLLKRRVAGRAP
jgi:hypothetical protein